VADEPNFCYRAFRGCSSRFAQDPLLVACRDGPGRCMQAQLSLGYSATVSRCGALQEPRACAAALACTWQAQGSGSGCGVAPGAVLAAALAGTDPAAAAAAAGADAGMQLPPQRAASAQEAYRAPQQAPPSSFAAQYLVLFSDCASRGGRAACLASPPLAAPPSREAVEQSKAYDLRLVGAAPAPAGSSATRSTFMAVVPIVGVTLGGVLTVSFFGWLYFKRRMAQPMGPAAA
jgi:hypothetical protein